MPLFNDHPYTSITIKIDQLSKPPNDEIDTSLELYVSDLVHLIKIQPSTGATEAARAIRKRIKYGDSNQEQIRALNILELLILNSGSKIGPVVARDDKLLDVLKSIINGSGKTGDGVEYAKDVQIRAQELAIGWKSELNGLDGYKYLASLYQNIPKRKHHRSRSTQEFSDPQDAFADQDAIRSPSPTSPALSRNQKHPPRRPTSPKPTSSSSNFGGLRKGKEKSKTKKKRKNKYNIEYADEQYKIPQINYKIEAPRIREVISNCHTHTTALNNLLTSLRSGQSPLDDEKVIAEFEKCKSIRRKVLKYLQYVGIGDPEEKKPDVLQLDEEFLGSLIVANEQLVNVFKRYDFMAGYSDTNPAPVYSDESSGESYYSSDDNDEDDDDDQDGKVEQITKETNDIHLNQVGSSKSHLTKSPPPRPSKPQNLKAASSAPHNLTKANTNTSIGDPFGDGNELNTKYL